MSVRFPAYLTTLLAAVAACSPVSGASATEGSANGGAAPVRRPLVVLKQAAIRGRVIFLADDDKEETPAAGLNVEVWTANAKERLYRTETDRTGRCTLPALDVGKYRLMIGMLILVLKVEDPDPISALREKIPKTILVFMPRQLEAAPRR